MLIPLLNYFPFNYSFQDFSLFFIYILQTTLYFCIAFITFYILSTFISHTQDSCISDPFFVTTSQETMFTGNAEIADLSSQLFFNSTGDKYMYRCRVADKCYLKLSWNSGLIEAIKEWVLSFSPSHTGREPGPLLRMFF